MNIYIKYYDLYFINIKYKLKINNLIFNKKLIKIIFKFTKLI